MIYLAKISTYYSPIKKLSHLCSDHDCQLAQLKSVDPASYTVRCSLTRHSTISLSIRRIKSIVNDRSVFSIHDIQEELCSRFLVFYGASATIWSRRPDKRTNRETFCIISVSMPVRKYVDFKKNCTRPFFEQNRYSSLGFILKPAHLKISRLSYFEFQTSTNAKEKITSRDTFPYRTHL